MNKVAVIMVGAIIISGCVSTRRATKKELLNLDVQHFTDTTIVADVLSNTVAEFSTLNGYRPKKFIGIGWLDSFLKGYLNKKTGKRYYQVYQFVSYQGRGWRLYNRVDFETPEGKKSKPLTRYHGELMNCSSPRGCTYEEHVQFFYTSSLLLRGVKISIGFCLRKLLVC
jgi:hypothetical protein